MPNATQNQTTLAEQFEQACNLAAKLYADGADTTEVDAEVERLLTQIEAA